MSLLMTGLAGCGSVDDNASIDADKETSQEITHDVTSQEQTTQETSQEETTQEVTTQEEASDGLVLINYYR